MRRLLLAAPALAVLITLLLAASARAEFGPIQLVSKSSTEQAGEAAETALSADGRYLAFRGAIGGLKGIFREDLQTGALVAVAVDSAYAQEPSADASAPSISADGRYVSFTTAAPLDPADDTNTVDDVYVADLETTPPTYELASALDGCDPAISPTPCGLSYGGGAGSEAAGRVALSGDGREVVFVTKAGTDLTSGSDGSTPGVETPAGQVVLRNLATDRSTLVSVERESGGEMSTLPVAGGAVDTNGGSGASLSADGSTVAWLGAHVPAQVPMLGDEAQLVEANDESEGSNNHYSEPLWRRVAEGPAVPTRRIVGGGDPLAPGCPPGGTLADPACQGPFPEIVSHGNGGLLSGTGWLTLGSSGTPQLSADGRLVVLIGNPVEESTDLFLVDMAEGLTRKAAVSALTAAAARREREEVEPVRLGNVTEAAVSANGERVAFTTERQQFPLSPPDLITPPPTSLGEPELYLIDLETGTMRRLTHGTGGAGEPSLGTAGASSPSLDGDGHVIAFSSAADNLVHGDANGASDAFVIDDEEAVAVPGRSSLSAPPPPASQPRVRWRLALSARSLPGGAVRVVVSVPGAGSLRARAGGALEVGARSHRLGSARARAHAAGTVRLKLRLPTRYRHLAHSKPGVYATARVFFRGPGGRPLHGSVGVRFRVHRAKHRHGGGKP